MALETGSFISDLVVTNPTGSDALAFADDHLRLLKSTIKATFPSVTGAVTKTHTELNALASQTELTALETSLTAAIAAAVATTKATLYPVGSIYTNSSVATNPGTLLGFGIWTAFGAGRVPVGFNAGNPLFDTAEETGGSADAVVVSHTHVATVTDPGHAHTYSGQVSGGDINTGPGSNFGSSTTSSAVTNISVTNASTGVSGTNANYQPYITVYMWKRTA